MFTEYTAKDLARFWKKVDKSPHSQGCWLWNAAANKWGYGTIGWGNGSRILEQAHRVSYLIHFGIFDFDLGVLHKCDNSSCVNPDHLFLGTNQDNIDDKISKGRQPRGESHFAARLNQDQVNDIKSRCAAGSRGIQKIVRLEYGISAAHISAIVRGTRWSA